MPISGVVITCTANKIEAVCTELTAAHQSALEIHGTDDKGHIVGVLETESSEAMENIINKMNKLEDILNVGLTYLNTEDEAERMARGEQIPKPFGFRKPAGPIEMEQEAP